MLIFASAIAGFLGDVTEAIIIVAILLANAVLGFSQEYRSERVLEELKKHLSYTTIVFRDGNKHTIDTKELVLGDIVYLAIGDIVPAEIRLLEADELNPDYAGEVNPEESSQQESTQRAIRRSPQCPSREPGLTKGDVVGIVGEAMKKLIESIGRH